MQQVPLRRRFLQSFLAFLVLTAVVAIIAVLNGHWGELELRILGSSGTVSAASVCAMACAAFVERGRTRALGRLGIALACAAALLLLVGIWTDTGSDAFWKTTVCACIWAAAVAHAQLLWLPALAARHRWLQQSATISIALLGAILSGIVIAQSRADDVFRVAIVLSILVALQTLAVPILARMQPAPASPQMLERLLLSRQPDGCYVDAAGNRYAVQRLADAPRA